MKNVFIVILNWNRADDTIECLKSVSKLSITGYKLSVVVVDNNSTDDSIKKITNNNSDTNIIKNKENMGYSGGNNVGIRHALKNNADYIMVLNNDTLLDTDLMNQFIK